jgi:sirohydrochlorin cobaltochelatase
VGGGGHPDLVSDPPVLPAIVLLAHGSPDPDWRAPIEATRDRMRELDPLRDIRDAYLAHCAPSLDEVVRDLVAAGHHEVFVIAAFLSAGGGHLKNDVPEAVERLRGQIDGLTLHLVSGALGAELEVTEALARAAFRRVLIP